MLQRNIDYPLPVARSGMAFASAPQPRRSADSETLLGILRSLRRNLKLIILCTLIGATVATAVAFSLTPQYKASVSIFIDPRRAQLLKERDLLSAPGPGTDTGLVESAAAMMKSPVLMRRVAEQLDLQNDRELSEVGVIGMVKRILLMPLRLLSGSSPSGTRDPLAAAASALAGKVDAKRRNLTYIIDLTVWSRDAAKAARIADAVAAAYLAEQASARSEVASSASKWLDEEAERLRARVTASENAYEKYKAESGLFAAGGEALSDRQLGQLNDQLVMARAKTAEAKAKFEQLKGVTPDTLQGAAASPDILQSAVISNLRGQYAEATKRQAEMTTRYGPGHPQVAVAQAQRRDVANQITAEIGRIVASAKTEYEMAAGREKSLAASLDELKERASTLNQASIRMRELERDAQANRELFQAFLSRSKEAAAQVGVQLPDARIVSPAVVPGGASFPPKGLIIALGLFGGLGLGVAFAFAREVFNEGFRSAEDLEASLGVHPLASIPPVGRSRSLLPPGDTPLLGDLRSQQFAPGEARPGRSPRVASRTRLASLVLDQPDSVFAESIRSLLFSLKHVALERGVRTVLVTSALPREGKSTIAANLARAAAAESHVLLVDGDFRRPSLAAAFDLQNSIGVADVLFGRSDLAASVRSDPRTDLHVIAGTTRLSGAEAQSPIVTERMSSLLTLARKVFDLVIVDGAPLLPIVDARMLIDQVDGVVMVVDSSQTGRDAVAAAMRESPGLSEKLIGMVLNRAVDEYGRYYRGRYVNEVNVPRGAPEWEDREA